MEGHHLDSHRRAVTAARAAADKKAEDTIVLDVGDIIGITEVFVITSGTNTRQVRTICDEIELALKREGGVRRAASRVSTMRRGSCSTTATSSCTCSWRETREYYALERLWTGRAPDRLGAVRAAAR